LEKTVTPEATGVDQNRICGLGAARRHRYHCGPSRGNAGRKGGLKEGDQILRVDDKPVPALAAMIESLKITKDKPIAITVLRKGEQKTFTVQPVLNDKCIASASAACK